ATVDPFTGAPVPAADDAGAVSGASDAAGRFRLDGVPAGGRYTLFLHRRDRAPLRRGTYPSWPGRTTDCGTFVLGAAGRIEGVAVDDLGRPLAGATVGLLSPGPSPPATTDAAGRFVLEGLDAGRARLGAAADGHVSVDAFGGIGVDVVAGETVEVRVELARAASISGRVVDEHGVPVPHVSLVAQPRDAGRRARPRPARTGGDGTFVLDGLPRGEAQELRVVEAAFGEAETVVATAPATDLELVVPRLPVVLVTAVDARSGAPVTLTRCEWREDGPPAGPRRFFASPRPDGAPGRYRVPAPREGTGRVVAAATGYEAIESPPIEPGGRLEIGPIVLSLVPLPAPAGLHGVVVRADDGSPLAHARVRLVVPHDADFRILHGVPVVEGSGRERAHVDTDAGGRFLLPRGPTDVEHLRVEAGSFAPRRIGAIDVPPATSEDAPFRIALVAAGRVVGAVRGLDGAPRHDLPVVLSRSDAPALVARTDAAGAFAFDDLAPGVWECVPGDVHAESARSFRGGALAETLAPLRAAHPTVAVSAGETARIDLDLRALGGAVAGRVRVDGVPRESRRVWLRPAAETDAAARVSPWVAWTGHRGRYEITRVPSGSYVLAVTGDRSPHPLAERTISVSRGRVERVDVDVVTGRIEGSVRVLGRTEPLGGSVVVRADPGGAEVARGTIAADGTFAVPELPPGRFVVAASVADAGRTSRPVVVAAGATAHVAFQLDPPGRIEVTIEGLSPEARMLELAVERDGERVFGRMVLREQADAPIAIEGIAPGSHVVTLKLLSLGDSGMTREPAGSAIAEVRSDETAAVTLAATKDEEGG
ncbi:MAG: carboxypeptidase regulatory-like domain-containing protein, partial [Planctomycetota bacterium JB042]